MEAQKAYDKKLVKIEKSNIKDEESLKTIENIQNQKKELYKEYLKPTVNSTQEWEDHILGIDYQTQSLEDVIKQSLKPDF